VKTPMSDDVKAAVEWLQKIVTTTAHGVTVLDLEQGEALLKHIDSFDARLAAAREEVGKCDDCGKDAGIRVCTGCGEKAKSAAREEQQKACEGSVNELSPMECESDGVYQALEAIRTTPLIATPLADELRNERACHRLNIEIANRDITALRARVAELEAAGKEMVAYNTKHFDRATAEFARAEKAEANAMALDKLRHDYKCALEKAETERDEWKAAWTVAEERVSKAESRLEHLTAERDALKVVAAMDEAKP
jgi:chromosome segregation ATPase